MGNIGIQVAYELLKPTSAQIKSLFEVVDVAALIREASTVDGARGSGIDDGPIGFWSNQASYRGATSELAKMLGMDVLNFLVPDEEFLQHDTRYPNGPTGAVSYFPTGIGDVTGGTQQFVNTVDSKDYTLWLSHITNVATQVGFKLIDLLGADTGHVKESVLNEDVFQRGSFKAVFMAGGPGSGKSAVLDGIFNIPDRTAIKSLTSTGLKVVNSDKAFEYLKKKHNIPASVVDMSDEERSLDGKMMYKSVQIAKKQLNNYLKGKLGIIIDGTGGSANALLTKKRNIEALGYDTAMVFVNTTLQTALDRNVNRPERTLDDKVVERTWQKVQDNIATYKSEFGSNFNWVDTENSKPGKVPSAVKKSVLNFIKQPVTNPEALKWIDQARKVI
jgi:predicted kinase